MKNLLRFSFSYSDLDDRFKYKGDGSTKLLTSVNFKQRKQKLTTIQVFYSYQGHTHPQTLTKIVFDINNLGIGYCSLRSLVKFKVNLYFSNLDCKNLPTLMVHLNKS